MGIGELIVILLSLSGLGIQADPKAPGTQEIAKYAPDSPDLMFHFDSVAVLPGNWKYLQALPDSAEMKKSPELREQLKQMLQMADGSLQMAKAQVGFDPITDLTSFTSFVNFGVTGDPMFIVVVRGTFPADVVDKI